MRALTIHQPYAELVARGEKRVENRSWRTHYRGPLAIHAGQSTVRCGETDLWGGNRDAHEDLLDFGAIIAVCELVDCLNIEAVRRARPLFTTRVSLDALPGQLGWVATHAHAEGPWCWVLEDVRRLAEPVRCVGRQSLWVPPAEVVAAIEAQLYAGSDQ